MSHLMPSTRVLHVVDAALAVWVAAWIGLGVAIGVNVDGLTALSRTAVQDGRAVESVGQSLHSLNGLPLIGGQISKDAARIERGGAGAAHAGQVGGHSIRALAVLLAIAVALLPSVPVFGFYLPAPLERRREARALRADVRQHAGDPEFEVFLAQRAVEALGYHRLRRASAQPWAELESGSYTALAAAELRRLGIDPRLLQSSPRAAR